MGLSELVLPTSWRNLIAQQDPSLCQKTKHAAVFAPLLSKGVEQVSQEKNWWKFCTGWLQNTDPSTTPAPFGAAILHAPSIAKNTNQSRNFFPRIKEAEHYLAK